MQKEKWGGKRRDEGCKKWDEGGKRRDEGCKKRDEGGKRRDERGKMRKGGGVAVGPEIQCSWEFPDIGVL